MNTQYSEQDLAEVAPEERRKLIALNRALNRREERQRSAARYYERPLHDGMAARPERPESPESQDHVDTVVRVITRDFPTSSVIVYRALRGILAGSDATTAFIEAARTQGRSESSGETLLVRVKSHCRGNYEALFRALLAGALLLAVYSTLGRPERQNEATAEHAMVAEISTKITASEQILGNVEADIRDDSERDRQFATEQDKRRTVDRLKRDGNRIEAHADNMRREIDHDAEADRDLVAEMDRLRSKGRANTATQQQD